MPTLADLYDIRTPMEAALKVYLDAATGATGHPTQGAANKLCPYYEIDFDEGSATGHLYPFAGAYREDSWNGTLRIVVITDRAASGQPATHAAMVAKIKAALAVLNPFDADALPLHELLFCRLSGSPFRCDTGNNTDGTELNFAVVSNIRSTAWALLDP